MTKKWRIDHKVLERVCNNAEDAAKEALESAEDSVSLAIQQAAQMTACDVLDLIVYGREHNQSDEDILDNIADYCYSLSQEYHFDDMIAMEQADEVPDGTLTQMIRGQASTATRVDNQELENYEIQTRLQD